MRDTFRIISGGGGRERAKTAEEREDRLDELLEEHATGVNEKPEWCIYGIGHEDGTGVVAWIRPGEGDEIAGREIVQLMNSLGGQVSLEMTEFNPELEGEPVYRQPGHSEFVLEGFQNDGTGIEQETNREFWREVPLEIRPPRFGRMTMITFSTDSGEKLLTSAYNTAIEKILKAAGRQPFHQTGIDPLKGADVPGYHGWELWKETTSEELEALIQPIQKKASELFDRWNR